MLICAGRGVPAMQDYSETHYVNQFNIQMQQGDPIDKLRMTLYDATSSYTLTDEDDFAALDETDPNGWPTCNLLVNPSFGGTYSGGVAPNWTLNNGIAGVTASSSPIAIYGSASQSLALSNVAANTTTGVWQSVTLPLDENQNPIIALPYYASVWYYVPASFSNTTLAINIEWWTANRGSFINKISTTIAGGATSSWQRAVVTGLAPATAAVATISLYATTTNASNSGTILFDGAQLEYATFANYPSTSFTPGLLNSKMGYHGGAPALATPPALGQTTYPSSSIALPTDAGAGSEQISTSGQPTGISLRDLAAGSDSVSIAPGSLGLVDTGTGAEQFIAGRPTAVVDGWFASAVVPGMLFDVGTLSGRAVQYVTLAGVASPAGQTAYTRGIAQDKVPWNALATYTVSITYRVTQPITAPATVTLGINYEDAAGNTLLADKTVLAGPAGENASVSWETLTLRIGPGTPYVAPAGCFRFKIFCGLRCNTTTPVSGQVAIAQISLIADPPYQQPLATAMTALQAGMYPTLYCDANQPGCYVENALSGLPYRQLRLFGGFLKVTENDYQNVGGQSSELNLEASDYGIMFDEAPANLIISPQSDYNAIQQIMTYAQSQGTGFLLGLDFTTYVAKIQQINGFVATWTTVRDALNKVCNQTVASWWVDPYKRLHYQPALAVSAPYALSDHPDYGGTVSGSGLTPNSFPFSRFKYRQDGNQNLTQPVIEGDTQLSSPQTITINGINTQLTSALASGTAYTSLSVQATQQDIPNGTKIIIGTGSGSPTPQVVTTTQDAPPGSTTIAVSSFTASAAWGVGTNVAIAASIAINFMGLGTTTQTIATDSVTTSAQLTQGTQYTALPVSATHYAIPANTQLVLGTGAATQLCYSSAAVAAGVTSIPISPFFPSATIASGTAVKANITYTSISCTALLQNVPNQAVVALGTAPNVQYVTCTALATQGATSISIGPFTPAANIASGAQINSMAPIAQIDSITISGSDPGAGQQVVGLSNVNSYSQGYGALYDPSSATIFFATAFGGSATASVQFRYMTPVLVRLHAPAAENVFTGWVRRMIYQHYKVEEIKSQLAAIDRANAELTQRQKSKPIGTVYITVPPWPSATPIRPGTAIAITHGPSKLNGVLFQVQTVTIKPAGNGTYTYELGIGYYEPDFMFQLGVAARDLGTQGTMLDPPTVLQDVLTISDGWALSDSISAASATVGSWGPPNSSTWGGSFVWT